MKLIGLRIIHDDGSDENTAIATVDHAPGSFKACYVTVTKGRDGEYHLTSIPPHINAKILDQAYDYGKNIIEASLETITNIPTPKGE